MNTEPPGDLGLADAVSEEPPDLGHKLMIVICEGDQEQGRVFESVEEIRTIVQSLRNNGIEFRHCS